MKHISQGVLTFPLPGFVSFVGSSHEAPIVILRDTGASQSLVLETILPISCQSDTGRTVLSQGVENNNVNVPLHEVYLKSNLITGPVVPVRKVDLISGSNSAGKKVVVNPQVSSILSSVEYIKLNQVCWTSWWDYILDSLFHTIV